MDLSWQSDVSAFEYAVYVGHHFSSKEEVWLGLWISTVEGTGPTSSQGIKIPKPWGAIASPPNPPHKEKSFEGKF